MPFGARIQYLAYVSRPRPEVVGCLQFSSPAWRMKARDQWIGWDDKRRETGLQQVVNNSRFLVLASIRNLASANQRHGAAVKTIFVYPLVKNAARRLRDRR